MTAAAAEVVGVVAAAAAMTADGGAKRVLGSGCLSN